MLVWRKMGAAREEEQEEQREDGETPAVTQTCCSHSCCRGSATVPADCVVCHSTLKHTSQLLDRIRNVLPEKFGLLMGSKRSGLLAHGNRYCGLVLQIRIAKGHGWLP